MRQHHRNLLVMRTARFQTNPVNLIESPFSNKYVVQRMCHPRDIVTATIRLAHHALHARIELRLLDETEKRIDECGATKIATS
eukprot:4395193-Pleurochrysis_carterae.AAC.1